MRNYGSRIRSRKRPTFWINGYGNTERTTEYETTTLPPPPPPSAAVSTEETKTDEYKRKFRPFFDKLYDKLTRKAHKRDPLKKYRFKALLCERSRLIIPPFQVLHSQAQHHHPEPHHHRR